MANYVLIGRGTTDSSGVARMTEKTSDGGSTWTQTNGYTGTGRGKVDFVASLSRMGLLFQHIGVTGTVDVDTFKFDSTKITETESATGTTVANSSDSRTTYWANLTGTTPTYSYDYNGYCRIEFDVVSVSGNSYLVPNDGTNNYTSPSLQTGHYKFIYNDNKFYCYLNDNLVGSPYSVTLGNYAIGFALESGASFKYKNFIIYGSDMGSDIESEPYEVLDCLYFDLTNSDTHTNYSKVNADLTFDTDKLVLTRTADGECYANYSGTIADYKGKTIKFECEIDSPVIAHTRIYQQVNGSYSNVTSEYKTSGLFVATSEINANATSILFRIMGNNLNSNQGLSFKNIKIYSI